jgi:uncharacterized protein (TIGR00255 family)
MTGYAHGESRDGILSIEIKGYNNRFLELMILLPPFLSGLEPAIRRYITKRFRRGKIEVRIGVKESDVAVDVAVNVSALQAYKKAFDTVASECFAGTAVDFAAFLQITSAAGVFSAEKKPDNVLYRKKLAPVLKKALERFEKERIREGQHTEAAISAYLTVLEQSVNAVTDHAPAVERSIAEGIRNRFTELSGNAGYIIDENRLLTEMAVVLAKYTIAEELQRIAVHLAEFRSEMARNESPGKKLDFLCQEINREVNTIGSKTPVLEISRTVVTMKDALENIREQLRNVE